MCYCVTYVHDPSSLNLYCNPHGRDIKLKCTVQEPATLKSPLSFLILWYWTRDGSNSTTMNAGCQLYPSYQCSRYVGHSKYMFEFKRYRENTSATEGHTLLYRKLELTIRNVTASDIGCYYCRPWIDLVPLNETSGRFCIEPQSSYEGLSSCVTDDDNSIMNVPSVISNEINSSHSVVMSTLLLNTHQSTDISSFISQPTNR